MANITLENLTLKRQNQVLLEQVNVQFEKGKMILLTGDTGSGKSTLFYLLAGLSEMNYQGKILLNGVDYQELRSFEVIQQVGLVFQNPSQQFTMKTLRRELYFALENQCLKVEEMPERIRMAIKQAKVEEILDQSLNTLSGGEKQRAALAVLLVQLPQFILLDEPFASVDPSSRKELITVLKGLAQAGKTIIITDHDYSDYAEVVDQFISLEQQKLVFKPVSQLKEQVPSYELTTAKASTKQVLTLTDVTIKQKQKLLLEDTSISIKKGITTLTGVNGSGKSTLLKAIVQQHPYRGKMFYQMNRLRRRRKIYQWLTLIVQEATKQYVAVTVEKELQFSPPKSQQKRQRQQQAMKDLGMEEWLTKSVYHLSGGQQKIVQLVVMLSLDVPLLLLDEPFTGLDSATCQYFMQWIKDLSNECDFVIVSHRLAPISGYSDHHIELSNKTLSAISSQEGIVYE
ncbi:energy-coupling factor transport system ATP-binding protein [Granulicatella balaenopterae]|uniref:Energy-coupling factor transport system ATP-binding protein n=1 Tax=Granulicatella balaenopterae TaxID=137733 RepID=A0A1H9MIK2_9LACT|nr:ABC transporter ATP-binding protein [Granulicatella balaenopterae]SER23522.1 energy-coupling factor transport system ATP-binding protein [Granulicatella balaenopterae]